MNENSEKALVLDKVAERLATLDGIISFLFEEIEVTIGNNKVMRKRTILTDGEKICVNQERKSLREYRDFLLGNMDQKHLRPYSVSTEIDAKLKDCLYLMNSVEWTKKIDEIEVLGTEHL